MRYEILHPLSGKKPRYALFDFDGTVSLLREGWQEIMYRYFTQVLVEVPEQTASEGSLREVVVDFVDRLTGKQTIFQAMRLAEEIRRSGGIPEDPGVYKAEYLRRLMTRICHRHEALRKGESPELFLVPGTKAFLEFLQSEKIVCYLASGTDEAELLEEAELLGLTSYFAGIYGAKEEERTACSKEKVLEMLFQRHRLHGEELISFGDGYVEIELTKQMGGYAVGVASDERFRSGNPDPWKRKRLLEAGADTIWPDFLCGEAFFELQKEE